MQELIDKNEAVRYLNDTALMISGDPEKIEEYETLQFCMDALESFRVVEAKLVVHGYWIPIAPNLAKCSVCGTWQKSNGMDMTGTAIIHRAMYRYCHNCGAEMSKKRIVIRKVKRK